MQKKFDYSGAIHPDFGDYTIKDDIIITPLWTEEFCKQMIDLVESRPDVMEKSYDDAQMFPLNELNVDLLRQFASHYKSGILRMLKKEWMLRFSHPRVDIPGLFTPFFLRYRMDQCRELGLHTDSGIVSMSLKCNSDYEGCDLTLPRQKFSAKDVPVGHAIFWPGLLTHPHYVTPLTSGIKYSFSSFACPPDQFTNPYGLYFKYVDAQVF